MKPANVVAEPSTTTHIRRVLMDRILTGEFQPGERIIENQIAAEFSVSRGPVREALRILEQSNLVRVVHNKGVFVRDLNIEDALHLYDIRAGLAYLAGKLLARRATSEQISRLYALHEAMEEKRKLKDANAYSELNEQFHTMLMRYTGNRRLIKLSESITRELHLFLRGGFLGPSRLRVSNEQHLLIIQKIEAGDAEGAALAFEEHVTSGKIRALDSLIAQVDDADDAEVDG